LSTVAVVEQVSAIEAERGFEDVNRRGRLETVNSAAR
jgi:hypothetical protein